MTHEVSAFARRMGSAPGFMTSACIFGRAVSRPTNLPAVLVTLLGWTALISWTGIGAASWQAHACEALDLRSSFCTEVRPVKDVSRIVPHTAELGAWAR